MFFFAVELAVNIRGGDEISRAHRLIVVLTMYDDDALLRIRCRNLTARQHLLEVSP